MKLRADGITWREIDGDLVILDLRSSTYLTTNATGALLMKELTEDRTQAQLVRSLVDAYDLSPAQAEADVESFVESLDKGGLLEPAHGVDV